jgi:hypothetical protein
MLRVAKKCYKARMLAMFENRHTLIQMVDLGKITPRSYSLSFPYYDFPLGFFFLPV